MAWLLREGKVLASIEVPDSRARRLRGVMGRSSMDGAVLLQPARAVHTFGLRFPVDVIFCADGLLVLDTVEALGPYRLTAPRRGARCVIEAEAGSVARWQLRPGDQLEVQG